MNNGVTNMSSSWVDEIQQLNSIAEDVSFSKDKDSFFSFTEQDRQDDYTAHLLCQFKITKTDELDLIALRMPQYLRNRIKEQTGSLDAEGSIILALCEYGLNELIKNNKRIIVTKNK